MRRLRRLPAEFANAVLYVSPAAGLRYIFRPMANVDPPLRMVGHTLVRKGDVIWDIGANVGLFSLAAAVCAGDRGQVIAFEPDGWTAQLLRRTRRAQPIASAPITVIPIAVAREVAEVLLDCDSVKSMRCRATRSTIAIPEEKKYRLPRGQCPETTACTTMTKVFWIANA